MLDSLGDLDTCVNAHIYSNTVGIYMCVYLRDYNVDIHFSPLRPAFVRSAVRVGFVVDKVDLWRCFCECFFSPLSVLFYQYNTLIFILTSPNIVRVVKSRRMRWAGHVARMGEGRGVHRVLIGKSEGKRPLGRPRRTWEDNIKMDLQEVGGSCGD